MCSSAGQVNVLRKASAKDVFLLRKKSGEVQLVKCHHQRDRSVRKAWSTGLLHQHHKIPGTPNPTRM